ncbi:ribosomal silencing factor RsfS [mine drainage metagenome]|jgi:ribosome-associated protein|uniref:Ribosomal silencing factor RsfS n=1 Tax=mine drainage metagenome TaxID=410659 RepID=A0A1J5PTS7_9ZZZZ
MDIRKLQRTIVDALEDVKAQDIQVFNTEALTSLFDRVIVASGSSNRQTRALAASVRDRVKAAGGEVRNAEGDASGEWVLVDCGDAVVHIMQPMIRAYYRLEDIWGGRTVHLKRPDGSAAQAASKPAAAKKAPTGRTASATKAAAAKKTPAAKKTASAKKTPAAKKAPAARKTPVAAKTVAAKTAAPRARRA